MQKQKRSVESWYEPDPQQNLLSPRWMVHGDHLGFLSRGIASAKKKGSN